MMDTPTKTALEALTSKLGGLGITLKDIQQAIANYEARIAALEEQTKDAKS